MAQEALRPVSGVTQWPWGEALPCNLSSILYPQPRPYSHHRRLASLALSLAKAQVSQSSHPRRPYSSPSPSLGLAADLGSDQRLLELEGTSCVPPSFGSDCSLF